MKLLIAIAIALIIILLAENSIRKHAPVWYWGAFLLSLLCMFLPDSAPAWISSIITGYISRGTFATALFILVMYARVLPPKSRLFRTLMSLRAPLAIMAALMILLHNGTYFIHYHENAAKRNITMTIPERAAAGCTTLMLLLLIPLTITSFTFVRKKMKGVSWKRLQRLSYVFYALIYTHVACLFGLQIAKGNKAYQLELAIYTLIFGCYLVCRVALYFKNRRKENTCVFIRRVGIPTIVAISLFLLLAPFSKKDTDNNLADSPLETGVTLESETIALDDSLPSAPTYQDGEWSGSGMGFNGKTSVTVIIADGMISEIKIDSYADDEPYFGWAKDDILPNILNSQSTDVDAVSGATFSSDGIKAAVQDALSQALITAVK